MRIIKYLFFLSDSRIQRFPDLLKVCLLFLVPLLVTVAIDWVWYVFLFSHPIVPAGDKGILLVGISAALAFHGYAAFGTIKKVWAEYDKTQDLACLVEEGKDEYMNRLIRVANRKIPLVSHIFLSITSVFLLAPTIIFPFESAIVGILLLSTFSFLVVSGWAIATELCDPISGYWIMDISDEIKKKIKDARRK